MSICITIIILLCYYFNKPRHVVRVEAAVALLTVRRAVLERAGKLRHSRFRGNPAGTNRKARRSSQDTLTHGPEATRLSRVRGRRAQSVSQRVRRAFGQFYVQGLQGVGQAVIIGDDHQQVNDSGVADDAPQGRKGGVGYPVLAQ